MAFSTSPPESTQVAKFSGVGAGVGGEGGGTGGVGGRTVGGGAVGTDGAVGTLALICRIRSQY